MFSGTPPFIAGPHPGRGLLRIVRFTCETRLFGRGPVGRRLLVRFRAVDVPRRAFLWRGRRSQHGGLRCIVAHHGAPSISGSAGLCARQ